MTESGAAVLTLVTLLSLACGVTPSELQPPGGFASRTYEVTEGSSVVISLHLVDAPTSDFVTTVTCTGEGAADLDPSVFNVTFASGVDTVPVSIAAVSDEDSSDETAFCVADLGPTSQYSQFAIITVIDDDNFPRVEFTETEYFVGEDVGSVSVCITLTNVMGQAVSVTLSAVDGSKAVSGVDYFWLDDVTIEFGAASEEGAEECVDITIIDDDTVESIHGFSVDIVSVTSPARTVNADTTYIWISDDDVVTVSLQTVSPVAEGSSGSVCVDFVVPSGGMECDVTVNLGTTDGKADTEDYTFDTLSVTITPTSSSPLCVEFDAIQDLAVEGEHDFTVYIYGFAPSDAGSSGSPISVDVTINDDDEPQATVSFTSSTYSVTEGDTVSVCVDRSLTSNYTLGCDLTVDLATENGSIAILGSDFASPDPSSVIFLADPSIGSVSTRHCFIISAILDSSFEGDHSFSITLQPAVRGVNIGSDTVVTITDGDTAVISMASAALSVIEDDTTVRVCAVLDGPAEGTEVDIVIQLGSTSSLKAVGDGSGGVLDFMDFSVDPPTVTFSAGAEVGSQDCVDIAINEDLSFEGNHSFTVTLDSVVSPSTGIIVFGSPSETVVTILDDDVLYVTAYVIPVTADVEEGGRVQVCTVVTFIPGGGLECNVTVRGETEDGTATSPNDYGGGDTTHTLTALNDSQCTSIEVLTDNDVECEEFFTLVIVSAGPGNVIVTPAEITITIQDTTEPTVRFTTGSMSEYTVSVDEGAGFVTLCASITFSGDLECDYEAPLFSRTDGIAFLDEDFSDVNSIIFRRGSSSGTEACTNITIIDDEALEGYHFFKVLLPDERNPTSGTFVVVVIIDNDVATIGLQPQQIIEGESEQVCAALTVPADGSEITLTVTFSVDNGTKAVEGEDFTVQSPLEVNFPPETVNDTQQCISIFAESDGILEGIHSFGVNLQLTEVNLADVSLDPASVFVYIVDGNSVSVELIEPSAVEEGNSVNVCAALTFTGATTALGCNITVYLDTDDEKAELGSDFYHPSTFSITFDTNSVNGSTACVDIPTVDDQTLEGDHNFSISLNSSNLEDNVVLSDQRVTAVINDNENATLGFNQLSYRIDEGSMSVDVCVEIFDAPIGGADCDITVYLAPLDGEKAVSSDDFILTDPTAVVFMADSDIAGATECATIAIVDDTILEGPHSFSVRIVGIDPLLMISNIQTSVTIIDNEEAVVAFSQAVYRVGEGAMSVEVQVELVSLPAGGLECPIVVTLNTTDGKKATNNVDFILEDTEVTFNLSSVVGDTQSVIITIIEDDIFENPQTFNVSIVSASPAPNVVVGFPSTAVVIINDNDAITVRFLDGNNEFWVEEGEGELEVCLTLVDIPAGGLEYDIAIMLYTSDSKAVLDEDFYEPYPFTFDRNSPANTTNCTTITIIDDQALEGYHDFYVHVGSNPVVVVLGHQYAIVYIHDNENATLSFKREVVEVRESERYQHLQFCLVIDNLPADGLECEVHVYLIVEEYTAHMRGDKRKADDFVCKEPYFYIVFEEGSENGSCSCWNKTVLIINDHVVEYDEHFLVSIGSSYPPLEVVSPDTAKVIILDDDAALVSMLDTEIVLHESDTVELCTTFFGYLQRPITFSVGINLFPFGLETGDYTRTTNGPGDDITLPVIFRFGDYGYSSIYVHSSGVLIFDGTGWLPPQPSDLPVSGLAMIAVYWEDVNLDLGGALFYRPSDDPALLVRASHIIEESFPVEVESFWPSWLFIATWVDVQASGGGEEENSFQVIVATDGEDTFVIVIYCDLTWGNGLAGFDAGDNLTYLQLGPRGTDIALLSNSGIRSLNVYKVDDGFLTPDSERNDILIDENQLVFGVDASAHNKIHSSTYHYIYECFSITAFDDVIKEDVEKFPLRLSSKDPGVNLLGDLALVTIVKDYSDVVYIDFVTDSYEVLEGDSVVDICVVLYGTLETRATAVIDAVGGTATADLDFLFSSVELVFDVYSDRVQCVNVPIINDEWVEYNETLHLAIHSDDHCVIAGFYTGYTHVYILDDDTVAIGLDRSSVEVEEEFVLITFCVSILCGSTNRTVTAHFIISDDTATAPSDYFVSAPVIYTTFTQSSSEQCTYVIIQDDEVLEDTEHFTVSIASSDPGVEIKPDYSETVVYITEDDDSVTIGFSNSSYSVQETTGSVTVFVNLVGEISRVALVTIRTISGTAEAGQDFTAIETTLEFSSTVLQHSIPINITQDSVYEDDIENFFLELTTEDPAVVLGESNASVGIVDDEVVITIEADQSAICEGDTISPCVQGIPVAITLPGTTDRTIILTISPVACDSAVDGSDFDPTPIVGIFTPTSETTVRGCIELIDDNESEPVEQFCLEGNTPNSRVSFTGTNTITVYDDDELTIQFYGGSPEVTGLIITGMFNIIGSASSVECRVTRRNNFAVSQNCSSGVVAFTSLGASSRRFTLTVEAQGFCGQYFELERFFRQDNDRCYTHEINEGIVFSQSSVTFEWQPTGPTATDRSDTFDCTLDSAPEDTTCTSPYTILTEGLGVGEHTLVIVPTGAGCTNARRRAVTFELP